MLIAIMGETFTVNNEVKDVQQVRSHLQFVMDNWWIDPIKNKDTIKYLIAAFLKEDESQEQEILNEVKENQIQLQTVINENFEDMQ